MKGASLYIANLSILLLSHICHSAFRIFQETYLLRQFTRHKFLTSQKQFRCTFLLFNAFFPPRRYGNMPDRTPFPIFLICRLFSILFPFTVRCRMNISILKIHVHFFSQKINPKITE